VRTLRLLDANRFLSVKKKIPILTERITDTSIGNINKIFRKYFIGNGVDSIQAKYKDTVKSIIMVNMVFKNTRMSFVFSFKPIKQRMYEEVTRRIQDAFTPILNNLYSFSTERRGGRVHVATEENSPSV